MTSERPERRKEDRFLSTLLEINHELTSLLDLDELLHKIAESVRRIIPFEIFAIHLLDEKRQDLYFRFSVGHPEKNVQFLRIPVGEGLVGAAAKELQPVVVDDVRNDPRYIKSVEYTRSELAMPLIANKRLVGVLDIESPEVGYFQAEQVRLLSLLAGQIAIAIENARLYERERETNELLALLYDISLDVGSTLEVEELVHRIAAAVKSTIEYQIFSILMIDERERVLRPRIVIRYNTRAYEKQLIPIGKGLVGSAAQTNQAIRIPNVKEDPRYIEVHPETVSEMVIPLSFKGKVIGILDLESVQPNYFTEYHQRFLTLLAARIASALVNADLYAKVSDSEKRLDRELGIAREIQSQLMPEEFPTVPPLTTAVLFRPVAHLGGDLYDAISFDDGRIAIVIGDVAGKGAAAALYAALSSGIIRTRALRKYPPGQMLELVNKTLYQRPIEGQYLALTYGVYDPSRRTMTLANSGLPYPLLVRGCKPKFLDAAGIPLGLFPESTYQEIEIPMSNNDLIVFYSDGVIESRNQAGEDFGLKRLAEAVTKHCQEPAERILHEINRAVEQFVGQVPFHDDRTLIVIKMSEEAHV